MPRRFVLFDFDGVIADSIGLAFEVAKAMHPHLTLERWVSYFEGNIYAHDNSECTAECRPAHEDYFSLYTPRIHELTMFDGMREALDTLREKAALVVISSSLSMDILASMKRFGIDHLFSDVMGKDVHTSKYEKIQIVLSRYDAESHHCIFVTDTLGDIDEAAQHGIGSIGCSWGFHSRETLGRGAPFRIVDDPADLPGAVDEYFAASTAAS